MSGIQQILGAARRQLLLVVLAAVVTGTVAYQLSSREQKQYSTSASLLLLSGATTDEGLFSAGGGDITRFSSIQIELMRSQPVVERATEAIGAPLTGFSVSTGRTVDILVVSSNSTDPARAQATVNAVIDAYTQYRVESETAELQSNADLLQAQSDEALDDLRSIDEQINAKRQDIANVASEDDLAALLASDAEIEQLQSSRPAAVARYQTLYNRFQDVALQLEQVKLPVERLSTAPLPFTPISPRPRQSAAFGVFAGLVLGLGAAALREQLDTRLRTRRELAEALALPVLAELPYDKRVRTSTITDGATPITEAIRSLRTSVEVLGLEQPIDRLMVTSATAGEGKTTVATSLAVAFAQLGRRVVLVSADLRRPMAELTFGLERPGPGVTDFVRANTALPPADRGRMSASDFVTSTGVDGVSIVSAGSQVDNPAELLASEAFVMLLGALTREFEHVIVDTPPLLAVADAAIVAQHVDAVIAVASLQDARRPAAERFADSLRAIPSSVIGLAINKGRSSEAYDSGGYYAYTSGSAGSPRPHDATSRSRANALRRDKSSTSG